MGVSSEMQVGSGAFEPTWGWIIDQQPIYQNCNRFHKNTAFSLTNKHVSGVKITALLSKCKRSHNLFISYTKKMVCQALLRKKSVIFMWKA
jgi:hypothetical protein